MLGYLDHLVYSASSQVPAEELQLLLPTTTGSWYHGSDGTGDHTCSPKQAHQL